MEGDTKQTDVCLTGQSVLLSAIFQIIQSIRMGMWFRRSLRIPSPFPHGLTEPGTARLPSRGPETDTGASYPRRSQRDSPPQISVYSVAVCGSDSFSMDKSKNHSAWRTCVSRCVREGVRTVDVRDCVRRQCANVPYLSVSAFVCVVWEESFFQINVEHLGSLTSAYVDSLCLMSATTTCWCFQR